MNRCRHCLVTINSDGTDVLGSLYCAFITTLHAPWPDFHYATSSDGRMVRI